MHAVSLVSSVFANPSPIIVILCKLTTSNFCKLGSLILCITLHLLATFYVAVVGFQTLYSFSICKASSVECSAVSNIISPPCFFSKCDKLFINRRTMLSQES